MKTLILLTALSLSPIATAQATESKAPILFYSSGETSADLSKVVFKYLMENPLKGPLTIYNISDDNSRKLLKKIGSTQCKFKGGMLGGVPMLFDGKKSYISDAGVIEYLNGSK